MSVYNYPVFFFALPEHETNLQAIATCHQLFDEYIGPIAGEKTGIDGLLLDFRFGLRLQVPVGKYHVRIYDADKGTEVLDIDVLSGKIFISQEKYYVKWGVDIYQQEKIVYSHVLDLFGKNVGVEMARMAMGDTIANLPVAQALQEKYHCNVTCTLNESYMYFAETYFPSLRFTVCDYGVGEHLHYHDDVYAIYFLGLLLKDISTRVDYRRMPIEKIGYSTLHLDNHILLPKFYAKKSRQIREKYVCFAAQASGYIKLWHADGGWETIVEWLKGKGYRVLCIDGKPTPDIHGNVQSEIPLYGAEDFTGMRLLAERIELLNYADFFIGLGSGLSWLAHACGIPVVLISGFSAKWCEFDNPYRVINEEVCHDCWSDVSIQCKEDHCARYSGTEREWECSRMISIEQVKGTIEHLLNDKALAEKKKNPKQNHGHEVVENSIIGEKKVPQVRMAKLPVEHQQGKRLFYQLVELIEQGKFDSDYLNLLEQYSLELPDSENLAIFAAYFALNNNDVELALEYSLQAFHKRKANLVIWQLLAECYGRLGRSVEQTRFNAYANHLYGIGMDLPLDGEHDKAMLQALTMAGNIANFAPFLLKKAEMSDGTLERHKVAIAGEYIPDSQDQAGYAYWVGSYVNQEILNAKGNLLARECNNARFMDEYGADHVFDIMRSRSYQELDFDPQGDTYILPLAGMKPNQMLNVSSGDRIYQAILGKWEYSYYRIQEPIHVTGSELSKGNVTDSIETSKSEGMERFVVGKPIKLGHSPKRKKLVLNILVDALSWRAMQESDYSYMPHTMEFFSRGVIFNQHFSVGEYTYPSLPTIETGMYPQHSQLFNERVNVPLDREYKTISEKMSELGYYCVNIMGGGDAIYNGAVRGYDHLITNEYSMLAYEGGERVIKQLEAFGECDQFLFMHIMDVHPWPVQTIQMPLKTQTSLSLADRLVDVEHKLNSVHMGYSPIYQDANIQGMRNTDRSLKVLFDYLQEHYDEDEYLVQLYSDHGCSVYDDYPRVMSSWQTGAAYMLRGAGVPQLGIVNELTSAVDIYPVMANLLGFEVGPWVDGNLPAVFGGSERKYTITNSIFPGQTYKLCIRDHQYEFNLESLEPVDEDGTVDFENADMFILERGKNYQQNLDLNILQRFMRIAREHTKDY